LVLVFGLVMRSTMIKTYDQTFAFHLPSGLLGEMLSGAFNVIGFSWIGSPAATELETVGVHDSFCSDVHSSSCGHDGRCARTTVRIMQIVMDWFGKLLGLPAAFLSSSGTGGGGCIQGALKHVSASGCACHRKLIHHLRAHLDTPTAQQAVNSMLHHTQRHC
jgi:hypothetical protein